MTDMEILDVFRAAYAGDQVAWSRLVEELSYQVRGWSVRKGANPGDLDDISQAVWLKLWLSMPDGIRFSSGAEMLGYLRRITEYVVIDAWRMAKARPQTTDQDADERGFVPVVFPLAGLTWRQRQLAALLWYGYNVKEIAAMFLVEPVTIYKWRSAMRDAYYG